MSKYMKRWNIPVPKHLDEQLEKYLEKDAFKTKSEFIRASVRDRLDQENKKMESSKENG